MAKIEDTNHEREDQCAAERKRLSNSSRATSAAQLFVGVSRNTYLDHGPILVELYFVRRRVR